MRAAIGLCLASLVALVRADDPVRHEPIHPKERIFTADEFRQDLVLRRAQDAIADYLSKNKPTAEQLQSMRKLAQSMADGANDGKEKPPISLPPELLANPQIQKLLTNEDLLKRILENKQLLDLAQRIASRFKPPSTKGRPSAPPRTEPSREFEGDADRTTPLPSETLSKRSEDRSRDGVRPPERTERPSDGEHAPLEEQREASSAGEDARSPSSGSDSKPIAPPTEDTRFKGWAEGLRRLGPMRDSETLSRLEQIVDGSATPSETGIPNNPSSTQRRIDNWLSHSWVGNVEGFKPENIPLPYGLKDWKPSLPDLPLPSLSGLPMGLPTQTLPQLGSLSLPNVQAISVGSLIGPGVVIALGVASFLVLRMAWSRWEERRRLQPRYERVRSPLRALDSGSRASIQEWFEYVACLRLGPTSRYWSHRRIARELRGKGPVSAERVSRLYEQARYLPLHENLDPELSKFFGDDIESLRVSQTKKST